MFLLFLSVVAICFLIWLLVRWWQVKRYWAVRGVPHYPHHPLLGSLTFLQRENPGIWMRQLYKDFDAPYVGIWAFWRQGLVINSPEIARRVLVKDADVFRNRFLGSGKSDPIGGLNLFTVNDPIWSSLRKRLTSVFTAAKLRALHSLTNSKASNLVERIKNENKTGELINLRLMCSDYTTDVIGEAAFGITSNASLTGDSVIRKVTREFMTFNLHRGLSWSSIFFFPELVDYFRFSFFPKDTIAFLKKVFLSIVEQRGGYEKASKEVDLLDALMKIKREAGNDEEITDDLLLAQAAIFLLGGFDTTGSSLTWIIYELAYNPSVQENLYAELLEAKEKCGSKDLDPSTLAELPYLNAVIKETLRKYPPMGWLDRMASKDYQIDDKLTIAAGTVIYVNATGLMMDAKYFPDPKGFKPERFLPENEKDITPFTYLPFGDGPRNCIGIRFAYQTLRYGAASIFLNYEARWIWGQPKPADCHIEHNGLLFMPDGKLSVEFVPRN